MGSKTEKNKYIAAIDVGTSKIICLVVELDSFRNVKIIGVGHHRSQGIGNDGVISDIKSLESTIISAISAAEKSSNIEIEQVYISVYGNHLKSSIEEIEIDISGGEVTDKDVKRINEMAFEKFKTNDSDVIQCVAVTYSIDAITGIANPRYMYGKRLKAYLNLVKIASSARQNLVSCLARCSLNVEAIIPAPYASALSCLSYEEMNNGAVVLDIGEGNTAISIFSEGKLLFATSLPLGGKFLTRDIQQIFSLSQADAERVKTIYGNVFIDSQGKDTIDLFDIVEAESNNAAHNYIQKHKLSEIIHDRMSEILNLIKDYLEKDKLASNAYQKAFGLIVITGGTSNLMGITQLAQGIFGTRVKVGIPNISDKSNITDEQKNPAFANIYGLIKFAMNHNKNNYEFPSLFYSNIFLNKLKYYSCYNKVTDLLRKYF